MQQIRWAVDCTEINAVPGFPLLRRVSEEVVSDGPYHWAGATRGGPDHFLIKLTLAGHGWFRSADQRYRLDAGDVFVCRICDPDVVYWREPTDTDPWEFIYFVFVGEHTDALFNAWIARRGPVAQLSPEHAIVRRSRRWRDHGSLTVGTGFGMSFLAELFRAMAASQPEADPGALRARQALDLMREHLADNWSVDDFAQAVGVTREQLTRDCQRYAGESPYRAYRRLRVDAAARELLDGTRPVAEIAATYGWATAAHFSRVFQQVTGTTPSRCRASRVLPLVPSSW